MKKFNTYCWRWACTFLFIGEVLLLLIQAIVISLPLLIIGGLFTWNITDEKPPKKDNNREPNDNGSFDPCVLV